MDTNIVMHPCTLAAIRRKSPRALAKQAGEIMYTPSKPCPYGHITKRYTKYGQCLDCLKRMKKEGRAAGRWKESELAYSRRYMKNNALKLRVKVYGLTTADFKNMLLKQNNKCLICDNNLIPGRLTHIDHCHLSGKVRGILCRGCNVGMGQFMHDPERMRKAAAYCEEL